MRINLVCVGKTADREIQSLMDYYIKRLPRAWNFSFMEIPDVRNAKNLSPAQLKKEEGKLILSQLEACDQIILLDENGAMWTSRELAAKIDHWQGNAVKNVAFVIGGAYGFSDEVYAAAKQKLSLSKMTFTHQMIRLFFTEQLYRADQILQGRPYHND